MLIKNFIIGTVCILLMVGVFSRVVIGTEEGEPSSKTEESDMKEESDLKGKGKEESDMKEEGPFVNEKEQDDRPSFFTP